MKTIAKVQLKVLDRIGDELAKLQFTSDPLAIEAGLYMINQLSDQAFKQAHAINHASLTTESETGKKALVELKQMLGVRS